MADITKEMIKFSEFSAKVETINDIDSLIDEVDHKLEMMPVGYLTTKECHEIVVSVLKDVSVALKEGME